MHFVILEQHQSRELSEVISNFEVLLKIAINVSPVCDSSVIGRNFFILGFEAHTESALVPEGKDEPRLSWVDLVSVRVDYILIVVTDVDMFRQESGVD